MSRETTEHAPTEPVARIVKDALRQWKALRQEWRLNRVFKGKEINCDDLRRLCLQHYTPIRQPLVLISQIQRSGGTLLSQLFDGHPECYAHPHELKIGFPGKDTWPNLDLRGDPEQWFRMLFELPLLKLAREGYSKGRKDESFPFLFLPSAQRDIFLAEVSAKQDLSQRNILDSYMTSYFNAWLNYQDSRAKKRIVTGFAAGLSTGEDNTKAFFDAYPDGRLITVIRDPYSWFASARRHKSKARWFAEIGSAMEYWQRSAEAIVRNKTQYRDHVCVVNFDDLVSNTEAVMRQLCDDISITYEDVLLVPTFNGQPIRANTSFDIKSTGVVSDPVVRKASLSGHEKAYIEEVVQETYNNAISVCIEI